MDGVRDDGDPVYLIGDYMMIDWIWMTLHTSMRDLSFLQWILIVGVMCGMIATGLWLYEVLDWIRKKWRSFNGNADEW